jgi:hypothetical protein
MPTRVAPNDYARCERRQGRDVAPVHWQFHNTRGFSIERSVLGPFLAADIGNFFGGGLSSWWIKRGWSVGRARRTVLGIFGPSMLVLIIAAFTSNYLLLISLFSYATFAYAACSTMFLSLPADVFESQAVGFGGRDRRNRRGDCHARLDVLDRPHYGPRLVPAGDHRRIGDPISGHHYSHHDR